MRYEFDFKMDAETLGDFYKSHNMAGATGFLWPMLGAASIAMAIFSAQVPVSYRLIYAVFGLIFLFYIPMDLKNKAKKQVAKNPYYAKPIHYIFDEDGVTTIQDENEATVSWKDFAKVTITKKSMILYMRNRNACVVSLDVFGKDLDKACEWIKGKVAHKAENKETK